MNLDEDQHGYTVKTRKGFRTRERPHSARENVTPDPQEKTQEFSSQTSKSAGKLKSQFVRQNTKHIGTDTSGAALETINDILNGITQSVNRLTELHCRKTDSSGSAGVVHASKIDSKLNRTPQTSDEALKPPVVKIRALRRKVRAISKKLSTITSSWSGSSVRTLHRMSGKTNEKKVVKEKPTEKTNAEAVGVDPCPTAPVKKKLKPYTKPHIERHYGNAVVGSNKPFDVPPHKLVEIYHNNAAKESDSEEEKNKTKIQVKIKSDIVPHLNIVSHDCGDAKGCPQLIQEDTYEEPHAPRACFTNKSYELPTIASKMKQAVKLDFNMFNFKAIPFCPVSSTTPSHNIGINIQQVMSIIKTRQPVQGISPTLAHNINLAAEKLNHDPLTSFVSSMTSKIGYGRSTCPLNKYSLNYRHLEEMARTLPEEPIEEMEEVTNVNAGNPAGPSGDMQMRNPPSPGQWTSDNCRRICTCVPTNGVDFHQVYNKYRSQSSSYDNKNHYEKHPPATAHAIYKKPSNEAASRRIKSMGYVDQPQHQQNAAVWNQENEQAASPLHGKEKNLKSVLMNLHDDFEAMNKKYEDLSNQAVTGDATQETINELEELEDQLNKKEEEINIVMCLYKEVVTLKQQVRNLKKYNSAMNNAPRRRRSEDYTSKTAQHITKLLQQIHYHRVYHRNGHDGYVM